MLYFQELRFLVEHLQQPEQSLLEVCGAQQVHLVVDFKRQVRADEVHRYDGVGDVRECKLRLVGYLFVVAYELDGRCPHVGNGRFVFLVVDAREYLGCRFHFAENEGLALGDALEVAPAQSLHDGSLVVAGSGHIEHAYQLGINAVAEEVLHSWIVYSRVFLAEDGKRAVVAVHDFLNHCNARLSSDEYGRDYAREHNEVACGQDWQLAVELGVEQIGYVAFVVGNHLYSVILTCIHI